MKVITNGTYQNERSKLEICKALNLTYDEIPSLGTVPQGGPSVFPALLIRLPRLLEQDEITEIV
jgi:hypothetical protein